MPCPDDKTNPPFFRVKFQSIKTRLSKSLRIGMLFFFMIIIPITAEPTDHSKMINCDVHHGTCTQNLQDSNVILDITPKPVKAMTDLTFTVTLTDKEGVSEPIIDLGMPGMKMGPNRIFLKTSGKGVYSGAGTIVRCPSGKKIWKATVTIPGKGSVEFVFDVIY